MERAVISGSNSGKDASCTNRKKGTGRLCPCICVCVCVSGNGEDPPRDHEVNLIWSWHNRAGDQNTLSKAIYILRPFSSANCCLLVPPPGAALGRGRINPLSSTDEVMMDVNILQETTRVSKECLVSSTVTTTTTSWMNRVKKGSPHLLRKSILSNPYLQKDRHWGGEDGRGMANPCIRRT